VAGPGIITWGEACRAVARRRLALPPVFTGAARVPLRLARVIDIPPEVLSLLRYGRGVDTTAFVDAGFEYRYTTPATVEAFAQARRLERVVGTPPAYEYERDVEAFFRNSRAVVHPEG
jgi:UDP-glucose 4-epimerase